MARVSAAVGNDTVARTTPLFRVCRRVNRGFQISTTSAHGSPRHKAVGGDRKYVRVIQLAPHTAEVQRFDVQNEAIAFVGDGYRVRHDRKPCAMGFQSRFLGCSDFQEFAPVIHASSLKAKNIPATSRQKTAGRSASTSTPICPDREIATLTHAPACERLKSCWTRDNK